MTIKELEQKLYNIYSKETCYSKCREYWNKDNPTLGHCAIVSLIVNDYFGGEIYRIKLDGSSHYFNVINNKIVDLTKYQFNEDIDYENRELRNRKDIINNEETLYRYNLLKERLELLLLDEEIYKCDLCGDMVEKFPNSKTISIGKNKSIIILGEAPANNGWRKSGIAWYDMDHKLLPSGVILQKLLDEIDIKLEDTYFLEAIKCYPKDRKYLSKCSMNCRKHLFKQLEMIKPKIVLALGDAATRSILDIDYRKFSEVVGKEFTVNGYMVIPVYHPSPVSPLSYKGNIDIFKRLRNIIDNEVE